MKLSKLVQTLNSGSGLTNCVFNDTNATYGNRPTITLTGDYWHGGLAQDIGKNRITVSGTPTNNGDYVIYQIETPTIASLPTAYSLSDLTDTAPVAAEIEVYDVSTALDDNNDFVGWDISWKKSERLLGGSNYGYMTGGQSDSPTPPYSSTEIMRYPFAAATTNSSDVGDLHTYKSQSGGCYSETAGFVIGGGPPGPAGTNNIFHFPFAVGTGVATTDLADLTRTTALITGCSSIEQGYGYGVAGDGSAPTTNRTNIIDRFPYANLMGNAADVGDANANTTAHASVSSHDYGYKAGGIEGTGPASTAIIDDIERWPFSASTTNATDIGILSDTRRGAGGLPSQTNAYVVGGSNPPPVSVFLNIIEHFPFSQSSTAAVDVGNLTVSRGTVSSSASVDYGYTAGGLDSLSTISDVIDRFPFSAGATNASDVGNLSLGHYDSANPGQFY